MYMYVPVGQVADASDKLFAFLRSVAVATIPDLIHLVSHLK